MGQADVVAESLLGARARESSHAAPRHWPRREYTLVGSPSVETGQTISTIPGAYWRVLKIDAPTAGWHTLALEPLRATSIEAHGAVVSLPGGTLT